MGLLAIGSPEWLLREHLLSKEDTSMATGFHPVWSKNLSKKLPLGINPMGL
jgi:hypothetical protein